jgi:hypothetical protein
MAPCEWSVLKFSNDFLPSVGGGRRSNWSVRSLRQENIQEFDSIAKGPGGFPANRQGTGTSAGSPARAGIIP